ncbi:MAG: hypothetical protein WDM76_13360 [Limisphaerales bacterium]
MRESGKSLLPPGVARCEGDFARRRRGADLRFERNGIRAWHCEIRQRGNPR